LRSAHFVIVLAVTLRADAARTDGNKMMGDPNVAAEDAPFDIGPVVAELRGLRADWRKEKGIRPNSGLCFPSRHAIGRVIDTLAAALFPLRLGPPDLGAANEDCFVRASLESALPLLAAQVRMELHYTRHERGGPAIERAVNAIVEELARRLPAIRRLIDGDTEAASTTRCAQRR
jgi:serine O-acetyltransferase